MCSDSASLMSFIANFLVKKEGLSSKLVVILTNFCKLILPILLASKSIVLLLVLLIDLPTILLGIIVVLGIYKTLFKGAMGFNLRRAILILEILNPRNEVVVLRFSARFVEKNGHPANKCF